MNQDISILISKNNHFLNIYRGSIQNNKFCIGGCQAIVTTGSPFILGPASDISKIMDTIGAILNPSKTRIQFFY